jgi:hypothetical protein
MMLTLTCMLGWLITGSAVLMKTFFLSFMMMLFVTFAEIATAALQLRCCTCVQSLLVLWEGMDAICRQ